MSTLAFYSKIERLPEHLQQQVMDYIDFLLSREVKQLKPEQQQVSDEEDHHSTDITPEQLAIIRRRMAEIESSTVQTIPGDVVKTKLMLK